MRIGRGYDIADLLDAEHDWERAYLPYDEEPIRLSASGLGDSSDIDQFDTLALSAGVTR